MKIEQEAIVYRKKEGATYFLIQSIKVENFSGCGCSNTGVITYTPEVVLGFGEIPEKLESYDVDGEKVVVFPEVEKSITEDTTIVLEKVLFVKKLGLKHVNPVIGKED